MILARSEVLRLSVTDIEQFADRLEQRLLRFERDWFAGACAELAEMSGVDAVVIRSEWLRRAYVSDCSMFCQLGQADALFVTAL